MKTSRGFVSFAPIVLACGATLFAGSAHSTEKCPEPVGGPAGAEMCDLGSGSFVNGYSSGNGISEDGTVAVGIVFDVNANIAGYMWSESDGRILNEPEGALSNFSPFGISADGLVVVGSSTEKPSLEGAVRWTSAGVEFLPSLSFDGRDRAIASDATGNRIVGYGGTNSSQDTALFWYKNQDTWIVENLGLLKGAQYGQARDISADGKTIVGFSDENNYSAQHAVVWKPDDQTMSILENYFTGLNYQESLANGVNTDGSVIVGYDTNIDRTTPSLGGRYAVRWVNGEVELLGTGRLDPLFGSEATATNGDGSVIVGYGTTSAGDRAFRWIEGKEIVSLGVLQGGTYSRATGVSEDGSVVVGTSGVVIDTGSGLEGRTRAFIWRGAMQDFTNLMASFPVLANDTDLAVSTQQWSLGTLLDQTAFVGAEGRNYFAATAGASNAGSGALSDSKSNQVAGLTFGRGISAELTVGASLQMSNASNSASGFDADTGTSVSVFGEYSKGGADRTGLQASLALGYASAGNTITRGQGFTDVEAASGNGDLETMVARVAIGYGIDHASGWLLTPHAAISQYSTSRGAYAEDPTATAFSAAYDELNVETTVGTAGIVGKQKLNDASSFSLGAGVDFDINAGETILAGSANIPGMEEFGVISTLVRNDVRPYVTADYSIDVASGGTFTASARFEKALYGNDAEVGVGVQYGISF